MQTQAPFPEKGILPPVGRDWYLYLKRITYYDDYVIAFYTDKDTEMMSLGVRTKRFDAIARIAQRKLLSLRIAQTLDDLASPPGNRLEALRGERKGQYSIRVNDQFRICFRWQEGYAHDVETVDYHS